MAEPASLAGRIARNTGMLFGGKLTSAVIGLLVLFILGNVLAPAEFGGLLLLHAYAASFSGLASFKSWQVVVNYGVAPFSRSDWPQIQKLIRFAMGLDGVGAIIAASLAVVIMPFAYDMIGMPDGYLTPALAYCALIFFNQTSASTGLLRLSDRFDLLSAHTLVMPVIRLVGVSICALLGTGLVGYIAVWFAASFLSYIALPLLALRELARQNLLSGLFGGGKWLRAPEAGIWRFAMFSNLDSTVKTASEHLPTLLAGATFGPGAAAIYRISRQIADLFARGVSQFDRVVHPEIARLLNAGESSRVISLAVRSSLVLLGLGLGVASLLALSGADILSSLLGENYADSAALIVLLLLAATLMAAAMPFYPILYACKHPARALASRLCGIALFLSLIPLLAQRMELESLGWAAIAGEAFGLTLVLVFAVRSLQARTGQSEAISLRTASTTSASDTPEDRSGGPGQPVSGKAVSANRRSSE
nr:lipopolysaccharide biosynthesis protein [Henriciella aquimarina]